MANNELRHWGVRGMKWGIRRKSPEERAAKLNKKAAKYDVKAERYRKASSRISDEEGKASETIQRVLGGARTLIDIQSQKDMGFKRKTSDNINNALLSQLTARNPKKELDFKAETYRRKAEKLRNKAMNDVNTVKAKKSFNDRVKASKEALKDPYNQEKLKRIALNTATAGSVVYANRDLIRLAANVGANLAVKKLKEKRARDAIPALPKKASIHKIPKMKNNQVYLVEPSGKLKKAGKFTVS